MPLCPHSIRFVHGYTPVSLNKSHPFMDQESLSLARLATCAAAVAFVLETQRALSLCRRWFGAQTAHPVGCHEKIIFAHVFGGRRWIKYIYEMEVMMISWYLYEFFPILKQLFLFQVLLTLCYVKSQCFALFQVALGPAMRAIWPAINCSARSRKSHASKWLRTNKRI